MILKINPDNPQQRLIDKVAAILKDGGLIIYPTDTQYGLGCDLKSKKAVERVYQIKKRNPKSPFSLICADLTHISEYAKVSNFAYRNMRRILPGPFTVILESTRLVPDSMMTKRHECGIRVPGHNIPQAIIQTLGNPIINTSAKLDGKAPPTNAEELEDMFKGQVAAVIDGGPVPGQPSTIVSFVNDEPEIIRQGLGEF